MNEGFSVKSIKKNWYYINFIKNYIKRSYIKFLKYKNKTQNNVESIFNDNKKIIQHDCKKFHFDYNSKYINELQNTFTSYGIK